jgi:putative membrane protein
MMNRGFGHFGGFGGVGIIFMVLGWLIGLAFLAGYIWMFIKVLRFNRLMKRGAIESKPALDIVNERYAKGEIDQKEYAKLSSDIKKVK